MTGGDAMKFSKEDLAACIDIDAGTFLYVPFRQAVVEVYYRLPEDVQARALEEIGLWILADAARPLRFGWSLAPDPADGSNALGPVVMVVPDKFVQDRSERSLMATIAHEIAHVILRDDDTPNGKRGWEREKAADDLSSSWGFRRAYGPKKLAARREAERRAIKAYEDMAYEVIACPHVPPFDEGFINQIFFIALDHDKPFMDVDDEPLHIHVAWENESWTVLLACVDCCFADNRPSGVSLPALLRTITVVQEWYRAGRKSKERCDK